MDNNILNNDWLDSILSDELLTADFGAQDDIFSNELDNAMFIEDNFNEPMFSSSASDSGLSSDNLDLDINNDFDLLNSCLPSPSESETNSCNNVKKPTKSNPKSHRQQHEIVQCTLKRGTRITKNHRNLSAPLKVSGGNNNGRREDLKANQMKHVNSKSRSIIVPVISQNNKDFRSIKIVNSGSSQLKTANIKAVAANLLQKSKQGLLQKNILITKQELIEDDAKMLNFNEIMQETDEMIAAHEENDDDLEMEDGDISSSESCSSGYPKLVLTNEEKRLLAKEGISLPSSYPLTKQEERELKRIRRKIRNKISAQDSRKRKKEYIDGLEERVKQCSEENHILLKRIKVLQSQNYDLMSKMKKLQSLLTKSTGKTAQPATCLMILLLSMALVAVPNLKLGKQSAQELVTAFGEQQQQANNHRNLLFDLKSELEDLESSNFMHTSFISSEHDYIENVYKYIESNEIPSPPPEKRSKTLIDYDIDSMDKWELHKRSHDDFVSETDYDMMDSNETELLLKQIGKQINNNKNFTDSHRVLAESIINLSKLQKQQH